MVRWFGGLNVKLAFWRKLRPGDPGLGRLRLSAR